MLGGFSMRLVAMPHAPIGRHCAFNHSASASSRWGDSFATTLNSGMRWLRKSLPIAVMAGASGGSMSFWAGQKAGAVTFADTGIALAVSAIDAKLTVIDFRARDCEAFALIDRRRYDVNTGAGQTDIHALRIGGIVAAQVEVAGISTDVRRRVADRYVRGAAVGCNRERCSGSQRELDRAGDGRRSCGTCAGAGPRSSE